MHKRLVMLGPNADGHILIIEPDTPTVLWDYRLGLKLRQHATRRRTQLRYGRSQTQHNAIDVFAGQSV